MAREWAVQSNVLAFGLVMLVYLAGHGFADISYRDDGPEHVDDDRDGDSPCSHYHDWQVEYRNTTRLCSTKAIATINGEFPGPTLYIREGDTVIVKVTNKIDDNVTIHWHGVRQLLQNWQDGPAYFTQCPIQPGQSFTYNFTINDAKRGTLWWHAHITWLRATVHGALVILPRKGEVYPFDEPSSERILILGEWWINDTQVLQANAARGGGLTTRSDAFTLNGQPGDLYKCSSNETTVLAVEAGRTYLLRIISASMNFDHYFSVADHVLDVVEADGEYTAPYSTDVLHITPGQSMNVLLKANRKGGRYYCAISVWSPVLNTTITFSGTPATAILDYSNSSTTAISDLPQFPEYNDTQWVLDFDHSIKSMANQEYPSTIPRKIDQHLLFTVGYNYIPCEGCGPNGNDTTMLVTTVSNNSFLVPQETSILEAYFNRINNVYTLDFPDNPPFIWNFTGPTPPNSTVGQTKTRVNVLKYGETVQLVWQNTNIHFFDSHPFHLHGFSFWVVGSGFGNFNATRDEPNFNLVDAPLRNTMSIPAGGWTAIRWTANNPGVWLMHCHIELHQTWGMEMAFIVLNGHGPDQTLPAPPPNMPKCSQGAQDLLPSEFHSFDN